MPFLLVTGLPCSGKTSVVNRVAQHFENERNTKVVIVREDECDGFDRNEYNVARKEKEWRAKIRREVGHYLPQDVLLICDALNYIKGYRYELYTLSKNAKTSYSVLYVKATVETCKQLNERGKKYTDAKIDELASRFEEPDAMKRWDSPLCEVVIGNTEDCLPTTASIDFEQLSIALYENAAVKPNRCTIAPAEHSTADINEVEKQIYRMTEEYFKNQQLLIYGDKMMLPFATTPVNFVKKKSLVELNRFKSQFLVMFKRNDKISMDNVGDAFVEYLNSCG